MITLGRRIASARIEAHLSIRALGRLLGKSEGAVRNYEKDRSQPSIEIIRQIAEITDKPLAYFYGEEDKTTVTVFKPGDPTAITINAPREIAEAIGDAISKQFPELLNPQAQQHPGIELLIADVERCQRLNATSKQLTQLRNIIIPGHTIETIYQAEDMLRLIQRWEREGLLSK